ncbi:hypothetical protein BJY00DRAFT_57440 [Aspergillus carlsbadensis]|nr:hypothetical protein BJY00DRAFT_57440 [Aspergillus carlsbadensis]
MVCLVQQMPCALVGPPVSRPTQPASSHSVTTKIPHGDSHLSAARVTLTLDLRTFLRARGFESRETRDSGTIPRGKGGSDRNVPVKFKAEIETPIAKLFCVTQRPRAGKQAKRRGGRRRRCVTGPGRLEAGCKQRSDHRLNSTRARSMPGARPSPKWFASPLRAWCLVRSQ